MTMGFPAYFPLLSGDTGRTSPMPLYSATGDNASTNLKLSYFCIFRSTGSRAGWAATPRAWLWDTYGIDNELSEFYVKELSLWVGEDDIFDVKPWVYWKPSFNCPCNATWRQEVLNAVLSKSLSTGMTSSSPWLWKGLLQCQCCQQRSFKYAFT